MVVMRRLDFTGWLGLVALDLVVVNV